MAEPWSREAIDLLETCVTELLAREALTLQDVGRLRWALARQQAYLALVYLAEGQREERLRALEAENEALTAELAAVRRGWDRDDLRW